MPWVVFVFFLLASFVSTPTRAIESSVYTISDQTNEDTVSTYYNTNAPTSANIPNWTNGWATTNITGWNYLGAVNNCTGVYLGYGWVITAAHVGSGSFNLAGTNYGAIPNSAQSITNSDGTADLTVFQISNAPGLPPLTVSTKTPDAFIPPSHVGTPFAMFGFGGGQGLTWGYDTMTETNIDQTPQGYTYVSTDFLAANGIIMRGTKTLTNSSMVIGGDSGGGDFTYNTTTKKWELSGINEVTGGYDGQTGNTAYGNATYSGMVELAIYANQINGIYNNPPATDTPTMPLLALMILACLLLIAASRHLGVSEQKR